MIAPTPFFADRGCHVRIYEEIRLLAGRGVGVRLCTYPLGRDLPGIETIRTWRLPGYRKVSAGASWPKLLLDAFLVFTLLREVVRRPPRLLHAHLHEGGGIALLFKHLLGLPLLLDDQGSLSEELVAHGFTKRGSLLYRFAYWLEVRILRGADLVIVSSPERKAVLERLLPPGKVLLLLDWSEPEAFRPLAELAPERLRRELSLPQGRPIAVYLGLLTPYQGIDLLIEAAERLGERAPHLLVIGYPEVARYAAKARARRVAATFTGRVPYERLGSYLATADFAVAPKISRTEANGKVLNFMAAALPVVAFDTPLNRMMLGEEGIYAPFGDPVALAEAIGAAAALDPERRRRIGRRLQERCRSHFSRRRAAEILEDAYRRLLGASFPLSHQVSPEGRGADVVP